MWYNLMWLAVDGVDDHDHDAIFNVDDMMMPWYYDAMILWCWWCDINAIHNVGNNIIK